MHPIVQVIVCVSAAAAAISTALMAVFVYQARLTLEGKILQMRTPELSIDTTTAIGPSHSAGYTDTETMIGHGIYVYKRGLWHLEADLSSPGYETTPPSIVGSFDGQVVRRPAQLKA